MYINTVCNVHPSLILNLYDYTKFISHCTMYSFYNDIITETYTNCAISIKLLTLKSQVIWDIMTDDLHFYRAACNADAVL